MLNDNSLVEAFTQAVNLSKEDPLKFVGCVPSKELLCKVLELGDEEIHYNIAKKWVGEVEVGNSSFKERRKKLERALQLLLRLESKQKSLQPETFLLIAQSYLLRSVFIRPHGFTIPLKKKEALKKAFDYVGKATSNGESDGSRVIKQKILLEQERISPSQNEDSSFKKDIVKATLFGLLDSDVDCDKEMERQFTKTIQSLDRHYFSHPLWNDVVWFLKRLRIHNKDYWKSLALTAYETCEKRSRQTSTLNLRMHWTGLRDLYDLAFLAADDNTSNGFMKMAKIADSSKNRSALPYMVWKNNVKQVDWEAEEASRLGNYIHNLPEKSLETRVSPEKGFDTNVLPHNWTAVHFYLNYLEKKGYALLYDGTHKEWSMSDFQYDKLFHTFLAWEANYSRKGMDAALYLVELCKKIGKCMSFLFTISKGHTVVFVPHDFLRRLPFHGAIDSGGKVFLEKNKCCYSPAWNLIQSQPLAKGDGDYLFKNYKEYDFYDLKECIDWNNITDPINQTELQQLTIHPNRLFFLCHGIADTINPFNSKLLLDNSSLAYRDVPNLKMNLNGSKIFLGACETDLLPPQTNTIDEYLSISSAFLSKGASEVLGTMWVIPDVVVERVFIELIQPNDSDCDTLQKIQKNLISKWRMDNENEPPFFAAIALRLTVNTFE